MQAIGKSDFSEVFDGLIEKETVKKKSKFSSEALNFIYVVLGMTAFPYKKIREIIKNDHPEMNRSDLEKLAGKFEKILDNEIERAFKEAIKKAKTL